MDMDLPKDPVLMLSIVNTVIIILLWMRCARTSTLGRI